jgi:hypothetical protein
METRKLTIDMIKTYIKNNIKSFSNEEIIEVKKSYDKKNNYSNETKEKTLNDYINKDFKTLKIESIFFPDLFSKNLLKDFLIFDSLYNVSFKDDNINLNTISFYYSVLSSLENNFDTETSENKYKLYLSLINYLKKDIMIDGFKQHKYSKLKWTKNHIFKSIENNIIDDKLIRYVSDALHINIFYIKNNKINYVGGEFIVFKKIVLLLNVNDKYYLICDNNNKSYYFNNNDFIKSIITNNSNINIIFEEKFNPVGSDWNKEIKIEDNKINKKETEIEYTDRLNGYDIDNTENNSSESESESEEENTIDDEINESLSLIELQKMAKEYKIDIFYYIDDIRKIKNKKQLCNEILKNKNHT